VEENGHRAVFRLKMRQDRQAGPAKLLKTAVTGSIPIIRVFPGPVNARFSGGYYRKK
jgi:hypothetical protein